MQGWLNFWFAYYPYIALSIMVAGLCFRYLNAPETWNAHSTQLMEKKLLRIASPLFHAGVLLAIGGHVAGLLVPEAFWAFVLRSGHAHDTIALFAGKFVVVFMLVGLGLLVARRLTNPRVKAASKRMDYVIAGVLGVSILTGFIQIYISHAAVFELIGPWLRGLLLLNPDPSLMEEVPFFMQLHVVAGFLLFALIPFSRLVHILSVPLTYAVRPFVVFRKYPARTQ